MTWENKRRGVKGKIAIWSWNGWLYLRWGYKNAKYGPIALGHKSVNRAIALAEVIEREMQIGVFDQSLERYFPKESQQEVVLSNAYPSG